MAPRRILGVILAGGRSLRMGGGDKCLLPLAGRPILAHVIERIGPQVGTLVLNANGDPSRFANFGLPIVADTISGFAGPLAGILAGLRHGAMTGADAVVTAAGDTPFLPLDLVARLAAAAGEGVAIAQSRGRDHPVEGLFPVDCAADLEDFIRTSPRLRVTDWVARQAPQRADFNGLGPRGVDPFFNINELQDLAVAEAAMMSPS